MRPGNQASVVLVFLAIAVLEMLHGYEGLRRYREDKQRERMAIVNRWSQRMATRLRAAFATCQRQSDHLASKEPVRSLLSAGGADAGAAELVLAVQDFVGYHNDIVELRLYDANGRFHLGAVRAGDGWEPIRVRVVAEASERVMTSISRGNPQSAFATVDMVTLDGATRAVLRGQSIVHGLDTGRGLLVTASDVSVLFNEIESYSSPKGVDAALLDSQGNDLAVLQGRDPMWLLRLDPEAATELRRGTAAHETEIAKYVSVSLGTHSLYLTLRVPHEALRRVTASTPYEYAYVVGPYVVVVIVLGIWGWIVLGVSRRAVRMAEAQRYAERIEREHQRYRALLEGAADMILIIEPTRQQVRECNAIARDTLGISEGAAIASSFSGDSLETLRAALHQARENAGRPVTMPEIIAGEARVPVDGRLAVIDLGEEQVIQVSLRDLRERKQMERQLQISDRLRMLGMMTAGVAHEINNPLEGIGNYLALLAKDEVSPEKRTRYLGNVRHGFDRIREIVQHFGAMVRPEPDREGPTRPERSVDLSRVVSSSVKLLSHTENLKDIRVDLVGLSEPLLVTGDDAQLEQVFWNLLLNAGRAMGGQGRISISARGIEEPGSMQEVEVTVADEGPGIPEESLERIFDPFFTREHGSGLGLFVSYGILQAHGGSLSAENVPDPESPGENRGACFTLRLIRGPEEP